MNELMNEWIDLFMNDGCRNEWMNDRGVQLSLISMMEIVR